MLDKRVCRSVEAFGKHLLYGFSGGLWLHIHLGLFGRFRASSVPGAEPRGAVRVRLQSATHIVDINGPNCCEILDVESRTVLLARIGPDVLRDDADPARAFLRISRSRQPIGLLLMDQAVLAGIGNIYRTEVLWRCRVHPLRPGNAIDDATFQSLWDDACRLLAEGVRRNAIVTNESALAKPARGRYRERVNIFGKSHCPACAGEVRSLAIGGRKAFVCETCQPRSLR